MLAALNEIFAPDAIFDSITVQIELFSEGKLIEGTHYQYNKNAILVIDSDRQSADAEINATKKV
jgi:hypothetical protein